MAGDEYGREFLKPIGIPGARLRVGYSRDGGEVTAFVVQLECQLENDSAAGEAGEWVEVVRSDHHSTSTGGHDVSEEGIHLDVYRDGKKADIEHLTRPIPVDVGFEEAEEQITDHAKRYIERFREWHRNSRDGSGRPNERSG